MPKFVRQDRILIDMVLATSNLSREMYLSLNDVEDRDICMEKYCDVLARHTSQE